MKTQNITLVTLAAGAAIYLLAPESLLFSVIVCSWGLSSSC
ncbi:MAG: hypothetical protein NWE89_11300 [Candidatus Bathyarchaeota archaeon]|nr:hypothetical protein [Candidatus Bathyarchaeota archaeon]